MVDKEHPLASSSQSNEARNLKQVHNLKTNLSKGKTKESTKDELLALIDTLQREDKDNKYFRDSVLNNKQYFIPCFTDSQLSDNVQFCAKRNEVLLADITFNLSDLWLTDTCYPNIRLVFAEKPEKIRIGLAPYCCICLNKKQSSEDLH